jgi:nitroreductase
VSTLNLSPDELLSTTRAVRKRLDLGRPVERELIEQCLTLAQQAPTGSNRQGWHFVVVTDPARRAALAELYRRAWNWYRGQAGAGDRPTPGSGARQATQRRVISSAQYLADRMHEVPVMVVPCIEHERAPQPIAAQAGMLGSILPAVWSFCLAARARGLGTCWTTLHLRHEEEAAGVLGIPYDKILQVALIPVAHTRGTDFKPGPREPLERIVHWEGW